MPQGPDGKTIIIVKKVSGHGGHHGGSWKVAYADFVTSMMAFFMVLWLVNSAATPTRERIASYFRAPGVFEKGSGTPMELGGAGILPDTFAPPAEKNSQVQPSKKIYEVEDDDGKKREVFGEGGGQGDEGQGKQKAKFEELKQAIENAIKADKQVVVGFIGQMEVKVDQRGLHLEIMDTPTASMFARGSAQINQEAEAELKKVAAILATLPNPIDIEGHTDAAPYRSSKVLGVPYDNWSLSTDRANAARRVLYAAGIAEKQFARVVGYSAQRLKYKDDPLNASNRRISISMRFTEQAAAALANTQVTETKSVPLPGLFKQEEKKATITNPAIPEPTVAAGNATPQSSSAPTVQPTAANPVQQRGLQMELSTSQADEAEGAARPTATASSEEELWREKDKIFGGKNPFFGQ